VSHSYQRFSGSGGVDLTMSNGAAIYYHDRFNQSTASSGAVACLYGLSAVFARGFGGYISDEMFKRMSMKGRLWTQMMSMVLQGILAICWSNLSSFESSVVMMVIFSIVVQISIGACYSIVPYVDGMNTGSVAGIVGAGGNVGAIILCLQFRRADYGDAAAYMGWFTIALALLTPFIVIKGYRGLLFGREDTGQTILYLPPQTR
jgi:MFS transporter, NNP family, nitrate/nitrite transporter